MYVSIFVAVIVVILCFVYSNKDKRKWEMISKIPGPETLPILGNAHQLKTGHEWYLQMLGFCHDFIHCGVFKVLLCRKVIIGVWNPKYVETLLSSTKHIDKASEYKYLHQWLGTGLLTSTGSKWRHRRKMLTPTFHFNILHDFVEVFNQQSRTLVSKFQEKCGKGCFNAFKPITHCALDIICETAMGTNIDSQSKDTDYVRAVYRMSSLADMRMRKPWYWFDIIYNTVGYGQEQKRLLHTLHTFTNSVIAERLEGFDEKKAELVRRELGAEDMDTGSRKNKRLAFLDMLLFMSDNLTELTIEDIREEVDTFMFEGHDTTAAAMSWFVHLIGAHPEVQEKVHEEMDSIFGDSDRDATMDDLKNMKYLECCIKEALRIFPSVPIFGRTIAEDLKLDDDITIPKGTTTLVITSAVHRDPEVYPDPEAFKPERFFLENAKTRHPYSYIPFSAGPRNCIGQKFAMLEEKTVLSHIFRNFQVNSLQKREDLRPVGDLILRPEHDILIEISPRTHT